MPLNAIRTKGSGRATCIICRETIHKGQAQTVLEGGTSSYRVSGRIHTYPRECDEKNNGLYRRTHNV